MGLEVATYISDLVSTNPVGASDRAIFMDDHIRLLKSTLQATFPNVSGAVTASHSELSIIDGVLADKDEINILNGLLTTTDELNYLVDTSSSIQTQLGTKRASFSKGTNGFAGDTSDSGSGGSTYAASHGKWTIVRGSTTTMTFPTTTTPHTKFRVTNTTGSTVTMTPVGGGSFLMNGLSKTSINLAASQTVEMTYIDGTTGWATFQNSLT